MCWRIHGAEINGKYMDCLSPSQWTDRQTYWQAKLVQRQMSRYGCHSNSISIFVPFIWPQIRERNVQRRLRLKQFPTFPQPRLPQTHTHTHTSTHTVSVLVVYPCQSCQLALVFYVTSPPLPPDFFIKRQAFFQNPGEIVHGGKRCRAARHKMRQKWGWTMHCFLITLDF